MSQARVAGFVLACAAFLASPIAAAGPPVSAEAVTPQRTSLQGGARQEFTARFRDGAGNPAHGEPVVFASDACGFFGNATSTVAMTNRDGLATVELTALVAGGFTCTVSATASTGARVAFDVLVYRISQLSFDIATITNANPLRTTELRAAVKMGSLPLYNVEVTAKLAPGSPAGAVFPESANTGQAGVATFVLEPFRPEGLFEVDVQFREVGRRVAIRYGAASDSYQDLWWSGPAESGWGIGIFQRADTLFAAIFAYDNAGMPTWFVMPGGAWNATRTAYSGALYRPRGSPYTAYDATRFVPGAAIGQATLRFAGTSQATLDYTIDGISGRKEIARQPFGIPDSAGIASHGGLWWGGAAQEGWGFGLLQQFRTLFAVWFTYDAAGNPTWFVLPGGFWSVLGVYEGSIYRTTGPRWLGVDFNAAAVRATQVGNYRLRLPSSDQAGFEYSIDGRGGSLSLERQPF